MKPVVIVNGKFMRDGVEVVREKLVKSTKDNGYCVIRTYPSLPNEQTVRVDIYTDKKLPDAFYDALSNLISTYTNQ